MKYHKHVNKLRFLQILQVQNQPLRAKALLQHRVNEQGSIAGTAKAKEKASVGGPNRLAGLGRENATGKASMGQKCSSGDIASGGITKCQKGTKQNVQRKNDRTGLAGKKVVMLIINYMASTSDLVHFC